MCAHHMIQGIELAESYFYKAFGLFITMKHHISIQGVISGTTPGRIFLSNNGDTAVLSNPQGIFLGGSPDNKAFLKEINMLLQEILLPQLASKGELDYVLYYPADEKWEAALETVMKDLRPMKSGRMTFTQHLDGIANPLGEDIVAIDRELLKQRHLTVIVEVLSFKTWYLPQAYAGSYRLRIPALQPAVIYPASGCDGKEAPTFPQIRVQSRRVLPRPVHEASAIQPPASLRARHPVYGSRGV